MAIPISKPGILLRGVKLVNDSDNDFLIFWKSNYAMAKI